MAATYADEDFYGREGEGLRSMGYSHCFCLGLISVGVPNWHHPAAAQDYNPANFPFCSFFAKLWDKLLRR